MSGDDDLRAFARRKGPLHDEQPKRTPEERAAKTTAMIDRILARPHHYHPRTVEWAERAHKGRAT